MRTIFRDSFGRFDFVRRTIEVLSMDCPWCGGIKISKAGKRFLYNYGVWFDGKSVEWDIKSFCSVECRRNWFTR